MVLVLLGIGCQKNNQNNNENTQQDENLDRVYEDSNTAVSFTYPFYMEKESEQKTDGSVYVKFKKRANKEGEIDNLIFSTKTKKAWEAERDKAKSENPNQVCESEDQFGCEKWNENFASYQRAISNNIFTNYYALGTSKKIINGIPFVVVVTYNIDTQQYQTKYIAYTNDTRITFIDPSTGGLEYGIPFQMNAKNRELVELTGQRLANREKVDDIKTRARADALFQVVSTVKVK